MSYENLTFLKCLQFIRLCQRNSSWWAYRYPYIHTNIQQISIYSCSLCDKIFIYTYIMCDIYSSILTECLIFIQVSSAAGTRAVLECRVEASPRRWLLFYLLLFLAMLDPFLWLWYWSRRSVILDSRADFCVIVNWFIDWLINWLWLLSWILVILDHLYILSVNYWVKVGGGVRGENTF